MKQNERVTDQRQGHWPLSVVGQSSVCERSVWVVLGFHAVTRQQKREHLVRLATHERLGTTASELTLDKVKLCTHTCIHTDAHTTIYIPKLKNVQQPYWGADPVNPRTRKLFLIEDRGTTLFRCGQHLVAIYMCHKHIEGLETERSPLRRHRTCWIVYLLTSNSTGRRPFCSRVSQISRSAKKTRICAIVRARSRKISCAVFIYFIFIS